MLRENQDDINIVDFKLSVTDAFVTSDEEYEIGDLFRDGDYFHRVSVANGGVWHRALGWLEDSDSAKFSHSLFLKATARVVEGGYHPPFKVTVKHMLRSTFAKDGKPIVSKDIDHLDVLIPELHLKNKAVVTGLLTDEMNKRVGLA